MILIAAPPRSGTTMLAGLLYHHGVWVGRARTTMYPGTNVEFGSENLDIKKIMKDRARNLDYHNWKTPFPDVILHRKVKDEIDNILPDKRWLFKSSWTLIFWKSWHQFYPDARWLFPVRETEKIIDSMNRHPGMRNHPDREKRNYIQALDQARAEAILSVKFYCFNIERLVRKDSRVISDLFDFVKLKPDKDKIDDWIQPDRLKR